MERVEEYVESLKACGVQDVRLNEDLKKHCTWHVGGVCDVLVMPKDGAEVSLAMRYANDLGLPMRVIGAGSNVLFAPHVSGVVIKLDCLKNVKWEENAVYAEAGVALGYLAQMYGEHNKGDFIFAAGIPGTVGGAVIMNAGAYGKEIGDLVEEVYCCKDGRLWIVKKEDCNFSYRNSLFQQLRDVIVVGARFSAKEDMDKTAVLAEIVARKNSRIEKQPLEYANAGSVFKNPPNDSAGRLIELAGLKGVVLGDAQISEKHGNFIINRGNASGEDILGLIRLVQKKIKEKFDIELQTEVELIGFDEV